MPGVGSYGPGGKWVHDRANRIMADGDVPKHLAYAIATKGIRLASLPRNTGLQRAS